MDKEAGDQGHLVYYKIGGLIRKYRKEKDLKLLDLSAITGIKSAMLSKIENGRLLPTIPTLFTIIDKLGIRAETFFSQLSAESGFPGYIFLPKTGFTAYEKEEGAVGFEYESILEYNFEGGAFQFSLLTLQPDCTRDQVTTAALEFVYVLEGSVEYFLEEKSFKMKAGDALFFEGTIPHVPVNKQKRAARLLVLYLFGNMAK